MCGSRDLGFPECEGSQCVCACEGGRGGGGDHSPAGGTHPTHMPLLRCPLPLPPPCLLRFNAANEEIEKLRAAVGAREAEVREAKAAEQEFAAECERLDREFGAERRRLQVGGGSLGGVARERTSEGLHLPPSTAVLEPGRSLLLGLSSLCPVR